MEKDPYDWPFPSRKDTMYLGTVTSQSVGARPLRPVLVIQDIQGARPRTAYSQRNRQTFTNRVDDIAKSSAKPLWRPINKPDFQLQTADIGAVPRMNKFQTSRVTNPLEPQYILPYSQTVPPPEPKFIRDGIDISDIQGTKPKPKIRMALKTQPEQPRELPVRRLNLARAFNILSADDINDASSPNVSKRVACPLEPQYAMPGDNGAIKYPMVQKSKPKTLPPQVNRSHYSLKNDDIVGATAATSFGRFKNLPSPDQPFNPAVKKDNFFSDKNIPMEQHHLYKPDIEGTKAGSRRVGLKSHRHTNPLAPKYQFPGGLGLRPTKVQQFDSFIK